MAVATTLGHFCWYDLMTTDPEAAMTFYGKIAGWGTEVWEGGPEPYTMWKNGDTAIGGVMELPEEARQGGAPPHWLAYVSTPDVDATFKKATELGATVYVPATEIPTVGKFAVLADPQGAAFAIYTSAGDTPFNDAPPKQGEFSWNELGTTDYAAAFDFYHAVFGWEKGEAMDMGEAGIYQMFGRENGPPLGGMFNKTAEMPGPPAWLHYIMVDDVHTSAKQVEKLGGRILNGPMEVPGGSHIVVCMDPQGAAFALHSMGK